MRFLWLALVLAGCASAPSARTLSSAGEGGAAGGSGKPGELGNLGHDGDHGNTDGTNGSADPTANFETSFDVLGYSGRQLCDVANIIVAKNDVAKLREYLAKGCSASVPSAARGSDASMFELAVAYRRADLLTVLLAHEKTRSEVDLYSALRTFSPMNRLKVRLNPFEAAVYSRSFQELETDDYAKAMLHAELDTNAMRMLIQLLTAARDWEQLTKATAPLLANLRASEATNKESAETAIRLIEARIGHLLAP